MHTLQALLLCVVYTINCLVSIPSGAEKAASFACDP
jgi:hypothetical protein